MDMSKTPIIPTNQDMLGILKSVRAVDKEAPLEIIRNLRRRDTNEYITCFMGAAGELVTLTKLFTSRAFLGKVISDRPAAHDDIRGVLTRPSTGHNEIVDTILLGVGRYLETHPDVAVKAGFTQRQNLILANRMTRHAESQHPYSRFVKQDHTCSL